MKSGAWLSWLAGWQRWRSEGKGRLFSPLLFFLSVTILRVAMEKILGVYKSSSSLRPSLTPIRMQNARGNNRVTPVLQSRPSHMKQIRKITNALYSDLTLNCCIDLAMAMYPSQSALLVASQATHAGCSVPLRGVGQGGS